MLKKKNKGISVGGQLKSMAAHTAVVPKSLLAWRKRQKSLNNIRNVK